MLNVKKLLTKILKSLTQTTIINQESFTAGSVDTWVPVDSFTLSKPALVKATSTYTLRTVGIGFASSGSITTNPDLGYIESDGHIYQTPAYLLPAGTVYLYVKVKSTSAANRYSVVSFG